jgi:transcriptional regulator with XRE-family HTH domain
MLAASRIDQQLLQSELADKLGKPQSFVSKYERGERRLDLVEFLDVCESLQIDAFDFIREFIKQADSSLPE